MNVLPDSGTRRRRSWGKRGGPVNLIQAQLGHADLSVTSRYLDHTAPQERVEALKGRECRV